MPSLQRNSPCKINLILNILGKRPDGFHELETLMHPIGLHDTPEFELIPGSDIQLSCSHPSLPCDSNNLVHRAATSFLQAAGIQGGVRIHLEKRVPLAAGLGGGSSNAAATLLALNELCQKPVATEQLQELAARLGSDVPFFLQPRPALATGRGERVEALPFFSSLRNVYAVLVHPGFGVSTPWAYSALAAFPTALHGEAGRAGKLAAALQAGSLEESMALFYNSLEAPVYRKYPPLEMFQEFFRKGGALTSLMSGSGSTIFALATSHAEAEDLRRRFERQFGTSPWVGVVPLVASTAGHSG